MAISRLTGQDATGTSGTTSVSATYVSTPTAGNLLIAALYDNAGTLGATITGWSLANSVQSSTSPESYVFYKVANGTESTTVTANSAGSTIMDLGIYEYTGFTGIPTLDKTAFGSGNLGVTSVNTGTTATTTAVNELLFVEGATPGVVATAPSWSNSFVLISTISGTLSALFTGQLIVAATGAYTSTVSFTGASNFPNAIIATFKGVSKTNELSILGAG